MPSATASTHPPSPLSAGADPQSSPCARDICASERLLSAAIQLFAEKGFANTSIRDLAQKAQVNVSAISYYFKDKVGLYKAAFSKLSACPQVEARSVQAHACGHASGQALRDILRDVLKDLIEPLKHGEVMGWHLRLRMREMLEPTGLWEQEIESDIAPAHRALEQCLCQALKIEEADERVQRLAFSITGMGIHLLVSRDVFHALHPHLLASAQAVDQYIEQLTDYAVAMVNVEKQRLGQSAVSN